MCWMAAIVNAEAVRVASRLWLFPDPFTAVTRSVSAPAPTAPVDLGPLEQADKLPVIAAAALSTPEYFRNERRSNPGPAVSLTMPPSAGGGVALVRGCVLGCFAPHVLRCDTRC